MVLDILLEIPRILSLILFSIFVALITTLAQKFFTNQTLLKAIKEEMSEMRKKLKTSKDKEEMSKINKAMMDKSMKQMQHSMRSIFITFIPLLLLFAWLNSNLTYYGIESGEAFSTSVEFEEGTTGSVTLEAGDLTLISEAAQQIMPGEKRPFATWELEGPEGIYTLEYVYGNEVYSKQVLIGEGHKYLNPELQKGGFLSFSETIPGESSIRSIKVNLERVHPFWGFALFGWRPGVLSAYIFFAIVFSTLLRKVLNVH
jgi:uncharacterized membrane protein (DUF106 family)